MYALKLLLWAPLLAAGANAAATHMNTATIVPGSYIVEFEDHRDSVSFFQSISPNASKTMDLNYKLFRGASIKFHDELLTADDTTQLLQAMPEVKRTWPVRSYPIPEHTVHWAGSADGMTTAEDNIWARKRAEEDTFSTHVMTQVDKLRAKGITGKGIKVAVVDTGVDFDHPALGGCFGDGCLVSFGYDLVGDAYNGSNTPVPGQGPPMDCAGHGTHVSGIIAAQGNNEFGVVGAATGVTLGMYKVFGCSGNVNDDVLIAAFNRAYESGANLITSSVGGSSGWHEHAWSVATSRIVANGVPCTVSAGNDGVAGLFYASSAADGEYVTAVASVDNSKAPVLLSSASYTVGNNATANVSFGYTAGSPANWTGVTLPLWAPDCNSTSSAADGCDPFGDDDTDLSGYIVFLQRGGCFFSQKAENAASRGAKYMIVYNNAAGTIQVDVDGTPGIQGMAMVTMNQAASWLEAMKRGDKVAVAMTDPASAPKTLVNEDNKVSAGFVSTYSSWGPTFEMEVKPQFTAPGGLILSTFPRKDGSFAVLSGTSMACPMVASIYALLMQARQTNSARDIENLLSATAKPNMYHNGLQAFPWLAPVPQQGGGLVQAYDAAYATTMLSESSLSFNDTQHHAPVHNFTISNDANTSVVYTLSNVGAGTAFTYQNDTAVIPGEFPADVLIFNGHATLNFTASDTDLALSDAVAAGSGDDGTLAIAIPAQQRRVVSVRAHPPLGLAGTQLPVYSGYIAINGSDGSALSLPYMGAVGNMRDQLVLDSTYTYLSNGRPPHASAVLANGTNATLPSMDGAAPVPPNTLFVLPPPGEVNNTAYDNRTSLVQLNLNFVMGTPLVRADLVPIRVCEQCNNSDHAVTDILGYRAMDSVEGYPMQWMARDAINTTWDGRLADGTYAPEGMYKLVVHALRIFGDAALASDYDVKETDLFRIQYLELDEPGRALGREPIEDVGKGE